MLQQQELLRRDRKEIPEELAKEHDRLFFDKDEIFAKMGDYGSATAWAAQKEKQIMAPVTRHLVLPSAVLSRTGAYKSQGLLQGTGHYRRFQGPSGTVFLAVSQVLSKFGCVKSVAKT